ncbi:hypothetical protein BDQ17DRAFT_1380245 [Cyathus striatus]|nr:hypothetical protein BDQ17DRAFT_1380245 [Cyathus striatus]
MNERGVVSVTVLPPRPPLHAPLNNKHASLPWLIRRIECVRGSLPIVVQCAPGSIMLGSFIFFTSARVRLGAF